MDGKDWLLIVGAIFTGLTGLASTILAGFAAIYASQAKIRTEEVAKVADKTHALVNSAMATQLRVGAVALRRVAELTGNPDDLIAANLAEAAYQQHIHKQDILDQKIVAAVVASEKKIDPQPMH